MAPKAPVVIGFVKPGAPHWVPFVYLEVSRELTPSDIVRGEVWVQGGEPAFIVEDDKAAVAPLSTATEVVVGESYLSDTCSPFMLVPERALAATDHVCYTLWNQPSAPAKRRVIVRYPR